MRLNKVPFLSIMVVATFLCSCTPIVPPSYHTSSSEIDIFEDYMENSQENKMLFPKGNVGSGCIGDPMPFYEDGKMNIFYLEDARNYTGGFHPVSLLRTEDYLTYEEYDRVIPFVDEYNAVDYAIGTGSCIRAKDGKYHFFYTGHNSNRNHGLPYNEKIQHAVSDDMINWTKLNDGFYGDTNDFRDPHVVYIEELDEYWMLITYFKNALGQIKWYTSKDLYSWTDNGFFYRNSAGTYNMECPTLIKFKGYWYLTFNEQGKHRVMRYRYKKNLTDEWIVPEVDQLDDEGYYAGKLAGDENRLFAYGWCGTKRRELDVGGLDWAGNLVGHELFQKENGELGIKPIEEVKNGISNRYPHKTLINQQIVDEIVFENGGYSSLAFEPFKENRYARISFDYVQNSRSGSSGITLNVNNDGEVGTLLFEFDGGDNKIKFYNNVHNIDDFGDVDFEIPFKFTNGEKIHIDVYYDDQVTSIYVNGEVALTARTYALKDAPFAIYAKDRRCTFTNIEFYE